LSFYHLSSFLNFNQKFNFDQAFKNLDISSHASGAYLLLYSNYMGSIWSESMGGNLSILFPSGNKPEKIGLSKNWVCEFLKRLKLIGLKLIDIINSLIIQIYEFLIKFSRY